MARRLGLGKAGRTEKRAMTRIFACDAKDGRGENFFHATRTMVERRDRDRARQWQRHGGTIADRDTVISAREHRDGTSQS